MLFHKILKAQSKNITSKPQRPEKTIVPHYILAYVFLALLKYRNVCLFKATNNSMKFLGSLFILLFIPQFLMCTYYMLSTMTGTKMTKMSKTLSFPWYVPLTEKDRHLNRGRKSTPVWASGIRDAKTQLCRVFLLGPLFLTILYSVTII